MTLLDRGVGENDRRQEIMSKISYSTVGFSDRDVDAALDAIALLWAERVDGTGDLILHLTTK